jgi:hypothetical protein
MFPVPQIARRFQGGSVNRRILRAAASVTAAGILVKIVATFKEFAVAGVYGRSDAMDAFLAAFLIPNLLINLISESMNQALVPTLVRVREQEGHDRAQQLLSSAMLWVCLLLTARLHRDGSHRARLFSADCLALSAGKARALHPALLRAAAGGAHHRHRHQLHRRSEHLRPLCLARSGAGGDSRRDHPGSAHSERPATESGRWSTRRWPAR